MNKITQALARLDATHNDKTNQQKKSDNNNNNQSCLNNFYSYQNRNGDLIINNTQGGNNNAKQKVRNSQIQATNYHTYSCGSGNFEPGRINMA